MQKFERTAGNDAVCQKLETLLARAREGRMNFVGFVFVEDDRIASDYVGARRSYYAAHFAIEDLKTQIVDAARLARGVIKPNDDAPGNMFFYDLTVEPACFDFVTWLANAELLRRRQNAPGPLRVALVKRNDEGAVPSEGDAKRDAFIKNVMVPALDFFGAVQDPMALEGRQLQQYAMRPLVEAARDGEEVPRIKVPQHMMAACAAYLKGAAPVTITLRETDYWTHRNSDIEARLKFARWLEARGERVIIVRDTAKADEPLEGFETCPGASRNLHMRAALYEQAKCNIFGSNGPGILVILGSRPWLYFMTVNEAEPDPVNRPDWWLKYQGLGPGEQLPWAGPQQRFVWAEDTFENLCAAWEQYMAAPATQAA